MLVLEIHLLASCSDLGGVGGFLAIPAGDGGNGLRGERTPVEGGPLVTFAWDADRLTFRRVRGIGWTHEIAGVGLGGRTAPHAADSAESRAGSLTHARNEGQGHCRVRQSLFGDLADFLEELAEAHG